jgi:proteasome lid subunit RPN8/RPN11
MPRKEVRVSEGQLTYFRNLARDSKLEIMAYLIGEVIDADTVEIDSFEYTKDYGLQKTNAVSWYEKEYERVQQKAESRGRRLIGYIHSHPNWDGVMSPEDLDHCVVNGLRLCGIVSTNNRKTIVRFWVIDSPLPCKIVEWNAKNPRAPHKPS